MTLLNVFAFSQVCGSDVRLDHTLDCYESFKKSVNADSILNQKNVYTRNFPTLTELLKNKDTVYFAFSERNSLYREFIENDLKKIFNNENLVVAQADNLTDTIIVRRQIRTKKKTDYIYGYWLKKEGKLYKEIITNKNKEIRYDIISKLNYESYQVKYTYKKDKLINVSIRSNDELIYEVKSKEIVKITYYHEDFKIQILLDPKGNEKRLIFIDSHQGNKVYQYKLSNN